MMRVIELPLRISLKHAAQLALAAIALLAIVAAALLLRRYYSPSLPDDLRKQFDNVARKIDSQYLSLPQQAKLQQQLTRLVVATKQQSITSGECREALNSIRHTVIEFTLTEGLVNTYIADSTLADAAKDAAATSLRRYAAAFMSGKVSEETAMAIESRAKRMGADGQQEFRTSLPDKEVRELLAAMDAAADEGRIPPTAPTIEVCPQVQEIVDRALGER